MIGEIIASSATAEKPTQVAASTPSRRHIRKPPVFRGSYGRRRRFKAIGKRDSVIESPQSLQRGHTHGWVLLQRRRKQPRSRKPVRASRLPPLTIQPSSVR